MQHSTGDLSASGGALNSSRNRKTLAQMMTSSALSTWRQRLDRSEGSSSTRAQVQQPSAPSNVVRPSTGPGLTLDQILSPAKTIPGGREPTQAEQKIVQQAIQRGATAAAHAQQAQGPYQYDLYPSSSSSHRIASPVRRSSPLAATRKANSFYPSNTSVPFAASRSTSSIDTTIRRQSPSRTQSQGQSPPQRTKQRVASPPPNKYAGTVDVQATQKRIQALMQEREAAASNAVAQGHYTLNHGPHAPAPTVTEPKYPRTQEVAAAKGARTMAQMKQDVAMRLHDRTHPDHPSNHPMDVDAAGIFHLAHHSARDVPNTGNSGNGTASAMLQGFTHPLQPDGILGDRRAESILATTRVGQVPITQASLAANAVPVVGDNTKVTQPLSFFPREAILPSNSTKGADIQTQPKLPQSAFLATMHAGALRVEHLLQQPRIQALVQALAPPKELSREAIERGSVSPPRTDSTVDRLLYDTITGKVKLDGTGSAVAGVDDHPVQAMAGYPNPSTRSANATSNSTAPFSRAALRKNEARLDALLALSSASTIPRLSYDPKAQEQQRKEEQKESFFDPHSVLGTTREEAQAATLFRQRMLDTAARDARDTLSPPSSRKQSYAAYAAAHSIGASENVPYRSTNVDVVLEELLGSPTKRRALMQVTNHPDPLPVHQGGIAEVLGGVQSPVRRAMTHLPEATLSGVDETRRAESLVESFRATLQQQGSSMEQSAAESAASQGLSITQKELEYLQASASLSPLFQRAKAHDAYEDALDAKAMEFRFIHASHLLRDAFVSWRANLMEEKERRSVLQVHRSEGIHGYEAWKDQKTQPILEMRKEHVLQDATVASSNSTTAHIPDANSALLKDMPIRPVSVAVAAVNKKTFAAEEGVSHRQELLATIHAQTMSSRRHFVAWAKYARVESIGKRMATKTAKDNLKAWFRNWRDLMRIARGEFHLWMHSKQADAIELVQAKEMELEEQAREEEERLNRQDQSRTDGEGLSLRDPPRGQQLYARASPHLMGTIPSESSPFAKSPMRNTISHSTAGGRASPSPVRYTAAFGGARASPSLRHSASAPPPKDVQVQIAPLTALLTSAYTQDQFWSHQESIWKERRAEEAARTHFAELKERLTAGSVGSPVQSPDTVRAKTSGPLLFQTGTSLHHPEFGVDSRPLPVAQAGGRNYVSADTIQVGLEHFRISSPVRTRQGMLLHEQTGEVGIDRRLLDRSPQVPLRGASPFSPSGRSSPSPQPIGKVAARDLPVAAPKSPAAPKFSPLKPPSFLNPRAMQRSTSPVHSADGEEPLSPVRRHVVPAVPSFAAASPPRITSATSHGFLPMPLATAANEVYFQSSHWQAPSPATITNEELEQNIRVAQEMTHTVAQQKEQNKIAQWKRIEAEKENYRKKVQEQHMHAANNSQEEKEA